MKRFPPSPSVAARGMHDRRAHLRYKDAARYVTARQRMVWVLLAVARAVGRGCRPWWRSRSIDLYRRQRAAAAEGEERIRITRGWVGGWVEMGGTDGARVRAGRGEATAISIIRPLAPAHAHAHGQPPLLFSRKPYEAEAEPRGAIESTPRAVPALPQVSPIDISLLRRASSNRNISFFRWIHWSGFLFSTKLAEKIDLVFGEGIVLGCLNCIYIYISFVILY